MNTKQLCSGCQQQVEENAPHGLCPNCLLKAGLDTGADFGPDSQSERRRITFVAPALEEVAQLFPQCEILGFIGQGGMGAVYKARQKELDRVAALKILPPDISRDAAFAERFTREARALAKLNHPGIVTLFEFGKADRLFYFLMEFVDGVNLRQLLDTGRLAPREALAIVPQICDALQYAHDQGIVHRDIKPENILLDRRGRVKVADFGLAKLVGQSGEPIAPNNTAAAAPLLTKVGSVIGTPQYMAPEQREHPTEVDHRADIYSLGAVFYQMLTGELPGPCLEAPSLKVQIDVRLDDVVLRALEKEPRRRYQQASEVKTAVETIARSRLVEPKSGPNPQAAPPALPGGVAAVRSSRMRTIIAISIAGLLCLAGVIFLQSHAPDFWSYGKGYQSDGTPQSPLFAVEVAGVGSQPTIAYLVRFSDPSTAPRNMLEISHSVAAQISERTRVMDRWRSDCMLLAGRRVGETIRIPLDRRTARLWLHRPGSRIGDYANCQKFWDEFVSPRIAEFDTNQGTSP